MSENVLTAAPPDPLDQRWYVNQRGRTLGSYTGHEIKRAIEDRRILKSDLIYREHGSAWVSAKNDDIICNLFQQIEPDVSAQKRVLALNAQGKGRPNALKRLAIFFIGVFIFGWSVSQNSDNSSKKTEHVSSNESKELSPLKQAAQVDETVIYEYPRNAGPTTKPYKVRLVPIDEPDGLIEILVTKITDSYWYTPRINKARCQPSLPGAGEESEDMECWPIVPQGQMPYHIGRLTDRDECYNLGTFGPKRNDWCNAIWVHVKTSNLSAMPLHFYTRCEVRDRSGQVIGQDDASPSASIDDYEIFEHGQLRIANVRFSDVGNVECSAKNITKRVPVANH